MAGRVCVVFVSRTLRSGCQARFRRLELWPIAGEYRNPRSRRTEIHRCKQMSWRIGSREPDTERDSEEVLFRPARRRDRRQRPTPQCLEVRRGRAVVSGWLWGIQPCSEMYLALCSLQSTKYKAPSTLSRDKGRDVNIIFSDLAIQTRTVDTEEVCRCLFVAASTLKSSFNHKPLNILERHVGRHIPCDTRRRPFGQRAVIKWQIDRFDLFVFGEQNGTLDHVL